MTVSILGCGWFGMALGIELVSKGYRVKGSVTVAEKLPKLISAGIEPFVVKFESDKDVFDQGFFECDVLLICIPPKFRSGEGEEYLDKLKKMIGQIISHGIKRVIYISSTGVYGDKNRIVNELSDPESDTPSARSLRDAELLFEDQNDFASAIIRFGGLVGPGRNPGRFFAGKKAIPNGRAPVNLIHLTDCIGITISIIEADSFNSLFNAVCPDHPHKQAFYRNTALKSGLPEPEFIDELLDWKQVESIYVSPKLHYRFKVDNWANCSFD
jgi:nucleoside-diphosphate-sugar epimerase